jgi:hypothetical protein
VGSNPNSRDVHKRSKRVPKNKQHGARECSTGRSPPLIPRAVKSKGETGFCLALGTPKGCSKLISFGLVLTSEPTAGRAAACGLAEFTALGGEEPSALGSPVPPVIVIALPALPSPSCLALALEFIHCLNKLVNVPALLEDQHVVCQAFGLE